jgi:small subunit ribosomal protein S8e
MGISRDSRHKRRNTGGRRHLHIKKRKFELARPPAMTKLSADEKRVRSVRARGGNMKYRALRLSQGNFSWGTEAISRKTRILNVLYNASNNELVRTNTLVKGCIVSIDSHPFASWYEARYGVKIGAKKGSKVENVEQEKKSKHATRKMSERKQKHKDIGRDINDQLAGNRLLACISSRPGQCGRADGYILEGSELAFYQHLLNVKKSKK